jgi:hypothetical protein
MLRYNIYSVLNNIIENVLTVNQSVQKEVARKDGFPGSQRRTVNQHRTGVVSRFMLRDILKRRSKHLWTEEFDAQ